MRFRTLSGLVVSVLLMSLAISAPGLATTSVIRNGSFDAGLDEWIVATPFPNWSPLVEADGNRFIQLLPGGSYIPNTELYQNLNVMGIAGKELVLSVRASIPGWTNGSATIDFYIDYVDTSNARHSVKALSYNGVPGDWATYSASVQMPSDARKLVRVSARQDYYAEFRFDDISLTADGVTIGQIPQVTGITPDSGPYGSTFTINGSGFGDNATSTGSVTMRASTAGLQIESWSDTAITVRASEPAESGQVAVIADFVSSNLDHSFTVESPYFSVSVPASWVEAIRGEVAKFVLDTEFFNGYTTSAGITFRSPDAPAGIVSFEPLPLRHEGGVLVKVDTAGLTPGKYAWHVESVEAHSLPRITCLMLEVVTVDEIVISAYDVDNGLVPIESLNLTSQVGMEIEISAKDSKGNWLSWTRPMSVTSGDPSMLFVGNNGNWDFRVCAREDGSTMLTASTPDGFAKTIPVTIDLPDEPRITSIEVSPSVVTNKGDQLVTMTATATHTPYVDADFLESTSTSWSDDGKTCTATGCVSEATKPGMYYCYAGADVPEVPFMERATSVTITNDPSRGEIRCSAYALGNNETYWSPGGDIEFYDSRGVRLDHRWLSDDPGRGYTIWYMPPGTYRLRYNVSQPNQKSQWWPNAYSFEDAADVVVMPGGLVDGISFFVRTMRPGTPPIVRSTRPESGAVGTEVGLIIAAQLSRDVDKATVTTDTFIVTDSSGNRVDGTIRDWYRDYAAFRPSSSLRPGETYTARVTTGVKDVEGNALAEDYVWSFSTAADTEAIGGLKALPDGVSLDLDYRTIHCRRGDFAYIEDFDRSSGIRLQGWIWDLHQNDMAKITGVMATNSCGERYIDVRSAYAIPGPQFVEPVGGSIRSLKTRMMDGLYVKAWGQIAPPITSDSFMLTDGSDLNGIVVRTATPHGWTEGQFVSVTGAAGWDDGRVIHAETVTELAGR